MGTLNTKFGQARYIVVPVSAATDQGALVAVIYSDLYSAPLRQLLLQLAGYLLLAFVLVAALAWFVAGRVLAPVQGLREATRKIAEGELDRRIEVGRGDSELDLLAADFNKMLDRLNEVFENQRLFIDAAGHELRTPLTVIQGHFELFKSDPKSNADSAEVVTEELRRMTRLTQELQSLTHSDDPNFLKLDTIDSSELAGYLENLAMTQDSNLSVQSETFSFEADRQKLVQVVLQLLENARKYAGADAAVRISIKPESGFALIEVEDSGSGVAPADREQIFEPFSRAKGTSNIEGSGLGLALSRAICRAHGGDLTLSDSELGGAKFTVRLPIQR
jgi:signal transduction histidine kinase